MKRRSFLVGLAALPLVDKVKAEPTIPTYRDEFLAGFNKMRFDGPVTIRDGKIEHLHNHSIKSIVMPKILRYKS